MAGSKDAFRKMSLNLLCEPPPKGTTPEQQFALHEFFHEVLVAGYKLYQKVPPDIAAPIIKEKFGLIIKDS